MMQVKIASRKDAERLAKRGGWDLIISILTPTLGWVKQEVPNSTPLFKLPGDAPATPYHAVYFDDSAVSIAADYSPPTREHLREILKLGAELREGARVLVHCTMGISRSPAVAIALLRQAMGPGKEQEACDQVKWGTRSICPNLTVIQLADELLNCSGALTRAVLISFY